MASEINLMGLLHLSNQRQFSVSFSSVSFLSLVAKDKA
jgi:hypothetical protein